MNIFTAIYLWTRLQIVFFVSLCVYTRDRVYLDRLVTSFSANEVSEGTPLVISESRTFATAEEKRMPLHSYVGAVAGARAARWEPLSFLSRARIPMVGSRRGSPREGVSRGGRLPLTGILFTSREYCQRER